MEVARQGAPYVIKRGVHETNIMCLDVIRHSSGTLVVPLLVWFICFPVLFFFSSYIPGSPPHRAIAAITHHLLLHF